ncbi:unnamed protein product [Brassicogethes aeneus]|uniref:Farnesoic acid O-methyl transferase domain-containing protein n=1 Tax=Brassicogethes aeneus TaxID=1431903 RepID=A0A9P0BDS4_BRAAE|nr:unnamed protein product [Brassicogethes aeneus]
MIAHFIIDNFTLIGIEPEKYGNKNHPLSSRLFTPKENSFNYTFLGIDSDHFSFEVEATNDVHVGLFSKPEATPPWYEIVIGGWGNTKSVLRKDKQDEHGYIVVESQSFGILDKNKPNKLWVRMTRNTIACGFRGEADPFISWWEKGNLPRITYVGFHTGFGSTGKWKVLLPKLSEEGAK